MMYSLNEIGLIPSILSDIEHRGDVTPYRDGKLPIFVSPMTCIVDDSNFKVFNKSRVHTIHPRKTSYNNELLVTEDWIALSLEQFKHWFNTCIARKDIHWHILIDVANGHMKGLYDCVKDAKQEYGNNLTVMIGNIANPETYIECCKAGVDYVRVGIGGGNACTTGVQTGIHASMVWLLTEINEYKKLTFYKGEQLPLSRTKIIADGGIDTIDKAIKCLALGADYVMMGKLFAQCEEACGKIRHYDINGICHSHIEDINKVPGYAYSERKYYGMASEQGQKDISGGVKKNPEGIETWVPVKYALNEFLDKFEAALRSSMSYCEAHNLDEFIGRVHWEPMTENEFRSYYK